MQEVKDIMSIFADANKNTLEEVKTDDDSGIEFKEPPVNDDDEEGKDDDEGSSTEPKDDGAKTEPDDTAAAEELPEVFESLYSAVIESIGLEDTELPKTPEELVDKISGLIKENSKPKYSSPISEEFDAFMAAGGTIEGFMIRHAGSVGFLPSIETEEDKISVIKQVLTDAGFSEDKINRKIEKYIENDTLEEEAIDAISVLAEKRDEIIKQNIENENKARIEQAKASEEFFKSVATEIGKLSTVRGVKVTPAQSKELLEYCLKVDKKDGLTAFQRDYAKSPVMNFIESAYFTKYGTLAVKEAEAKGSTSAIEKFKASLKQQRMSGTERKPNTSHSKDIDAFVRLGSTLSGKK